MFEGACLCGDVSLIYDLFITLKLEFRIRLAAAARACICPCLSPGIEFAVEVMSLSEPCLFFFGCNIYPVCYLRGEHIVCSKALMRINQTKREREQENLLLFGFFFFVKAEGFAFFKKNFNIGAYSFRELKKKCL